MLDAAACALPISILSREFDRLGLSSRTRQALAPIKAAAGAGLLVGLWAPLLGALTAAALIVYFLIAIGVHVRAGDAPIRSANAVAMLGLSVATFALTYLPAI